MQALSGPNIVQSFLSVLAAGATLLRHNMQAYKPFVQAWCTSITAALQALVVETPARNKSLADLSSVLPTLAEAQAATQVMPPQQQEIYVYWGYLKYFQVQMQHAGPLPIPIPGFQVDAFGARLNGFDNDTGVWQIDNAPRFSNWYQTPPATDDFLPLPGQPPYTKQAWWPLAVNFAEPWPQKGLEMKATADALMSKARKVNARLTIDEQVQLVRNALAQVTSTRDAISAVV